MIDYSELPQELIDQLSKKDRHNLLHELHILFSDGKARSIDETLVDYWKKHKRVVKRTTMTSALADLAKRSQKLRRCGKGVYVLASISQGELE